MDDRDDTGRSNEDEEQGPNDHSPKNQHSGKDTHDVSVDVDADVKPGNSNEDSKKDDNRENEEEESGTTPSTSSGIRSRRRPGHLRRPRESSSSSSSSDSEYGDVNGGDAMDAKDEGEEFDLGSQGELEHINAGGVRRRRKIRRRVSSSSNSSDTSRESSSSSSSSDFLAGRDDSSREHHDEENNAEDPPVLSKVYPRCQYPLLSDLVNREMFHPSWRQEFMKHRMGSLSLACRLEIAFKLEGHEGCVNSLDFDESGSLLASGSDDLNIIVWDWARKKKEIVFPSKHKSNVFQTKFLPLVGNLHIVSSSRDGQIRLAELTPSGDCRCTKRLVQHKGPANKVALLSDCPHSLLSGAEDSVVYSIDIREPKQNKILVQKNDKDRKIAIYTIDSDPYDSKYFCTAGRDEYVRIYDRRKISEANPLPVKKFCPHHLIDSNSSPHITSAVYSHDGTEIVASYNDEAIYLFNASHSDGADYRKKYEGHRNSATVKQVNFYGPRSEFVISGSDCGKIFLWSKDTEAIVRVADGDVHGVVNVLLPHPNLPYLATSGLDDDIKIWYPTADSPQDRNSIEKAVKQNAKAKSSVHLFGSSDGFDGQMMLALLRQIRRSDERRRRQQNGDTEASRVFGDNIDLDSSDEDDDESDLAGEVQCPMS